MGRKHTEQAKKKMSDRKKGIKRTEEEKLKISTCLIGRKHSPERNYRKSERMKGRTFTENHINNLSAAMKLVRSTKKW